MLSHPRWGLRPLRAPRCPGAWGRGVAAGASEFRPPPRPALRVEWQTCSADLPFPSLRGPFTDPSDSGVSFHRGPFSGNPRFTPSSPICRSSPIWGAGSVLQGEPQSQKTSRAKGGLSRPRCSHFKETLGDWTCLTKCSRAVASDIFPGLVPGPCGMGQLPRGVVAPGAGSQQRGRVPAPLLRVSS